MSKVTASNRDGPYYVIPRIDVIRKKGHVILPHLTPQTLQPKHGELPCVRSVTSQGVVPVQPMPPSDIV